MKVVQRESGRCFQHLLIFHGRQICVAGGRCARNVLSGISVFPHSYALCRSSTYADERKSAATDFHRLNTDTAGTSLFLWWGIRDHPCKSWLRFWPLRRSPNLRLLTLELSNYLPSMPKKQATIETNRGTISAGAVRQDAPNTVANFEKLANSCFYDGRSFIAVIPSSSSRRRSLLERRRMQRDRSAPAGPVGRSSARPRRATRKHVVGALSMAHAGKDTGGKSVIMVLSEQTRSTSTACTRVRTHHERARRDESRSSKTIRREGDGLQ